VVSCKRMLGGLFRASPLLIPLLSDHFSCKRMLGGLFRASGTARIWSLFFHHFSAASLVKNLLLLQIAGVQHSIISNTQFEHALLLTCEYFRGNNFKIFRQPTQLFQHSLRYRLVEASQIILRRFRKLYLSHVSPRQTKSGGNLLSRNCFTRFICSQSTLKFELKLVSEFETFVRIAQHFRQCLNNCFADELSQVVHSHVGNCCMRHVSLLKIFNLHKQGTGVNGCRRTPGITRAHIQWA